MAPAPLDKGDPSPAVPPFDTTATSFTVRHHCTRMLTLAAACFIIWCSALAFADGLSWPYKDMLAPTILVGPFATISLATSPFTSPYLIVDTANRTIQGPVNMWFSRFHPRVQ
jgi:hypothetical protein